jgi:hypothetical protein
MNGVDPWAYMQDLAGRLDRLSQRGEIEAALDDLEYLMEALDPQLQGPAYDLVERLRHRLDQAIP